MRNEICYNATAIATCTINAVAVTYVQQLIGIVAGLLTIGWSVYKIIKEWRNNHGSN